MRLKPKVLFLIGGLAAISAASSQHSGTTILSANDRQDNTLFWASTHQISIPPRKTKKGLLSPMIKPS